MTVCRPPFFKCQTKLNSLRHFDGNAFWFVHSFVLCIDLCIWVFRWWVRAAENPGLLPRSVKRSLIAYDASRWERFGALSLGTHFCKCQSKLNSLRHLDDGTEFSFVVSLYFKSLSIKLNWIFDFLSGRGSQYLRIINICSNKWKLKWKWKKLELFLAFAAY